MPYHHLGREVFLTPVRFGEDGWFRAGHDGTCDEFYEIPGDFVQKEQKLYTFENTDFSREWCYLRHPHMENYQLEPDNVTLTGTDITLNEPQSPTFLGIRQRDFDMELSVDVTCDAKEAGVTAYMNEDEHYEIGLSKTENGVEVFVHLHIGDAECEKCRIALADNQKVTLLIKSDACNYHYYVKDGEKTVYLASARTKYLSSEVSSGFTGVVLGLYAVEGKACFENFCCRY